MIKSSPKNSSSTERKLAKKALRRSNQFVALSSYDRIFPEWFLAEAQSVWIGLSALQQFFSTVDAGSSWRKSRPQLLPLEASTWAIASDTQVPNFILSFSTSSEPPLLSMCSLLLALASWWKQLVALLSFLEVLAPSASSPFSVTSASIFTSSRGSVSVHQLVVNWLAVWAGSAQLWDSSTGTWSSLLSLMSQFFNKRFLLALLELITIFITMWGERFSHFQDLAIVSNYKKKAKHALLPNLWRESERSETVQLTSDGGQNTVAIILRLHK